MNKAYRLIWSQAKDAWIIVAEIVKGNGGPPPITMAAVIAATMALLAGNADALPTGQQVVNGAVSFATSIDNKTLTITNSPNSIINWQGFSIAAGERTSFNQQNTSSAVLNRVIGAYKSDIFGMLDSNGKVFLINPNGVLFGAGSQINVAGLVASSLGMTNNDFLNGNYRFTGDGQSGFVTNQGNITTAAGGKVWLIAPQVENQGIINAPDGDVLLAAGQSVHLVDPNNPEVAVVVSAPTDAALNLGTITAQAGKVGIFGGLVNQQGIISADSVVAGPGGRIFLKSTNATTLGNASITSANARVTGDGGRIVVLSDGETKVAGTLSATGGVNGGNGGFIETSGPRVKIADNAIISTLAPGGKTGTWLIDPSDFTVAATGGDITGTQLSTNLGSNNVVIESADGTINTDSNGDIFVNDAIAWNAPTHLTFLAENNIQVNQTITANNKGSALTLDAKGMTTVSQSIEAGSIDIYARGTTATPTPGANGIQIEARVTATGGDITMSGTGSAGDDSVSGGTGVLISNSVATFSGNLTITGFGGAGVGSAGGAGIKVIPYGADGPYGSLASGTGSITLTGTGGFGGVACPDGCFGEDGGIGVLLNGNGTISTSGIVGNVTDANIGNITITGTGGTGGTPVAGPSGAGGTGVSSSKTISTDITAKGTVSGSTIGSVTIVGTGGAGGAGSIDTAANNGSGNGGTGVLLTGRISTYAEAASVYNVTNNVAVLAGGDASNSAVGVIDITGSGGNGGNTVSTRSNINAVGGNGGTGIDVQDDLSTRVLVGNSFSSSIGTINLVGTGGNGGTATGGNSGSYSNGSNATGGNGGVGISIGGSTRITTDSASVGNISLNGTGGNGGDATGGDAGYADSSNYQGGNAYAGRGGDGISTGSFTDISSYSAAATIRMDGLGGNGGSGTGGYGNTNGNGGGGDSGNGGHGIFHQGQIGSPYMAANVLLTGTGGNSGEAVGGNSGTGDGNGGNGFDRSSGHGLYLNNGRINTGSGNIVLAGTGGAGGSGTGGDGYRGAGDGTGGDGGKGIYAYNGSLISADSGFVTLSGYGGAGGFGLGGNSGSFSKGGAGSGGWGGRGIELDASSIITDTGGITMTGRGGNGNYGRGGSGYGLTNSSYPAGSGRGGDGNDGVYLDNGATVKSGFGNISLTGFGGDGGHAYGGSGGDAYTGSAGYANGGDGGHGVYLYYSGIMNTSGNITITGTGGAGGNGIGGAGGYGDPGISGGRGSGGNGGDGIKLYGYTYNSAIAGSSTLWSENGNISLTGTGGSGGNGFGGSGGDGYTGGLGGNGFGGNGGAGITFEYYARVGTDLSGNVTLTGIGSGGGNGYGGSGGYGYFGSGGDGGIGGGLSDGIGGTGINIISGDIFTSGQGTISLTGTGGLGGSGSGGFGEYNLDTGRRGSGGNGFGGYGGSGISLAYGASVSSKYGVSFNGTGGNGGSGTGGDGGYNHGGANNQNGYGGSGTGGKGGSGVLITDASVSSRFGDVSLFGIGGDGGVGTGGDGGYYSDPSFYNRGIGGNAGHGVDVNGSAATVQSQYSSITVHGVAGKSGVGVGGYYYGDSFSPSVGYQQNGSNGAGFNQIDAAFSAANGTVALTADSINLGGTINALTVSIGRETWGDIDLIDGSVKPGNDSLEILGSELGSITTDNLNIGNQNTNVFNQSTVLLTASNSITLTADFMTLAADSLNAPTVGFGRASWGGIGWGVSDTTGTLGIDASKLSALSASTVNLIVGNRNTGTFDQDGAPIVLPGTINSLSLIADGMTLSGGITVPVVSLTRATYGSINLGGTGGLALTQADIDSITASTALRIGDLQNTDSIDISGAIARNTAGKNTLHLVADGAITQVAGGSLTVSNLAAESNYGNIDLSGSGNAIAKLAVQTGGNSVAVTNKSGSSLTVGLVDGLSGVAAYADVTLKADKMNIDQPVTASTVTLAPVSDSHDLIINSDVSKESTTALELNLDTDLANINASNLILENGVGGSLDVTLPVDLSAHPFISSLTLSADDIILGSNTITTGGMIAVRPYTTGTAINLDSDNIAFGTSAIPWAQLAAGTRSVGSALSGDITVSAAVDTADTHLILATGGKIAVNNTLSTGTADLIFSTGAASTTTQGSTAYITTGKLGLLGGTFNLTAADNQIGTVSGNAAAVDLVSNRGLTVGDVYSTSGLTSAGNIKLTATGGGDENGITVDSPISITGNGTVSLTGLGGSGSGPNLAGAGIRVNNTITSAAGSITLDGTGGSSVNFDGGVGVLLEGDVSSTGGGNVWITGTGGSGTGGGGNGIQINSSRMLQTSGEVKLDGEGGTNTGSFYSLGRGVSLDNAYIYAGAVNIYGKGGGGDDSSRSDGVNASGVISATNNIEIIGVGGNSSKADGGTGIEFGGSIFSSNGPVTLTGTGGSGGVNCMSVSCSGYAGGNGINVSGSLSTAGAVNITGTGGAGGSISGYSGSGGSGALGINVIDNGSIRTSGSGTITMIGTGGDGGNSIGGAADSSGGAGGTGISIYSNNGISTNSGAISMTGTGGKGGFGTGGNGSSSGGSGSGGSGGYGFTHEGGVIESGFGNVNLSGFGGAGGAATGGAGAVAGTATGGYGATGIKIYDNSDSYGTVRTSLGNVFITGTGGNGGVATSTSASNQGGGGVGVSVDGGKITAGSVLQQVNNSTVGTITLTGTGGNGAVDSTSGVSGSGGNGVEISTDRLFTANEVTGDISNNSVVGTIKVIGTGGDGGTSGSGVSTSGLRNGPDSVIDATVIRRESKNGTVLTTGNVVGSSLGGIALNGTAGTGNVGIGVSVINTQLIAPDAVTSIVGAGGINLSGVNNAGDRTVSLTNSGSGDVSFTGNSGTGNLSISGSNSAVGGAFSVSENSGGLFIGAVTTAGGAVTLQGQQAVTFTAPVNAGNGAVSVTSSTGAISGLVGSSSIVAASAQLIAQNGIGATAPFQTSVDQLTAINTTNAVQLNNTLALTVNNLINGGSLLLDNQGALTLSGWIESTGSTVTITAHSPLTVSSGETLVRGNGTVTLFAGASGSVNDNLNISSQVISTNGDVILKAGHNVIVDGVTLPATDNLVGNPFLTASTSGKVTILGDLNPPPPLLTTQTAALLPGVTEAINDWVGTMGNETTDLSDEEPDTNEGETYGTEFSALPFCN